MKQDANPIHSQSCHHSIEWQGRPIRISYHPNYFDGMAHVEIYSGDKVLLPITETGYKSHFFATDNPPSMEEIIPMIVDWLNREARSKKWQQQKMY